MKHDIREVGEVGECSTGNCVVRDSFNLGHLLVLLSAGGSVLAMVREAAGRPITPLRLFVSPLLATLSTLLLMLLPGTAAPQPSIYGIALMAGLLAGAVRGSWTRLQADHMWNLVRLPRGKDGLWIAAAFTYLGAIAIAAALVGLPDSSHRMLLAAGMVFCASVLDSRAGAVFLRLRRAPHCELRSSRPR